MKEQQFKEFKKYFLNRLDELDNFQLALISEYLIEKMKGRREDLDASKGNIYI